MAPKRVNHRCGNFKSGSNGLAMVDYPTYNPVYGNRRHSLVRMNFGNCPLFLLHLSATFLSVVLRQIYEITSHDIETLKLIA